MKVIIAIGGRGKRLGKFSENYPSKAFICFRGKTLLEHHLDNLIGISNKVYLAYNYKDQKDLAKKIIKKYEMLRIGFIKCSKKDPFFSLIPNQSCLLIFSDTLINKKTLCRVLAEFKKRNITITLRQRTCPNSDKITFLERQGQIYAWKKGKPNFEIGQLFYFSKKAVNIISDNLFKEGRFFTMRKIIELEGVYALPKYCVNINETKDLKKLKISK